MICSEHEPAAGLQQAFRLVTIGTREQIKRSLLDASSGERKFLRAILAQYSGDVDGAIRSLKRLISNLKGNDQAIVAECLAPMLVMRHESESVLTLSEVLASCGWIASSHALRSLVCADRGHFSGARYEIAAAQQALQDEQSDVRAVLVLQRLARCLLLVGDYDDALNLAAAGAAAAIKIKAWRVAAANFSVSHNVHFNVTGQHHQARRFANLWYDAASRAGDASFTYPALIAEYEMAVQFADDTRIKTLERVIQEKLLPQQYAERFYYGFSFALARGADDVLAMRTLLNVIRDSAGLGRGQRALCASLIALADAAALDDRGARSNIREAIAKLGRPSSRDVAHEAFNRRMARGTIAAVCVLIGDNVRADRVVATKEMCRDITVRQLPNLIRLGKWEAFPSSLAGFARVYRAAMRMRVAERPQSELTASEIRVLRLYDKGWNARRIARETDRSVHTIYSHSRSIFGKLEAANTLEAVAIARERGLLT